MDRATEILVIRRDARPKVHQREVEIFLDMPAGALSGMETRKIGITDEDFQRIRGAIQEISARKRETAKCAEQPTASAGI